MHAVRDVGDVAMAVLLEEVIPHIRGDFAVQSGDRVANAGVVHGEDGHVEHGPPGLFLVAETPQLLSWDAEALRPGGGELFEHLRGEGIVAGGNRCMGREYRVSGYFLAGLVEVSSSGDHLPNSFEDAESGVALVHVINGWFVTGGPQCPHATDAQNKLLSYAGAVISTVESGGQCAILGSIFWDVRVQQQDAGPADLNAPDLQGETASRQLHLDGDLSTIRSECEANRTVLGIQGFIDLFLHTAGGKALAEIALSVEDTHADERDSQVRRALYVVSG
jgi:hypothetical protein